MTKKEKNISDQPDNFEFEGDKVTIRSVLTYKEMSDKYQIDKDGYATAICVGCGGDCCQNSECSRRFNCLIGTFDDEDDSVTEEPEDYCPIASAYMCDRCITRCESTFESDDGLYHLIFKDKPLFKVDEVHREND